MRFKFKLLLSTLVFLSACQTRLSFEGRRYTKGVYYNVSHGKTKHHNKFLKLNTKPAETTFVYATQDIKPHTSLVKNPEVLKHNTQQPKQAIKAETVFNDKSSKMYFNTKPHYNNQSKAFNNSKTNVSLKLFLTQSKGWEIFKIVMLCILNFWIGIFGIILFALGFDSWLGGPEFIAGSIPFLALFAYLCYYIIKRIKNLKTTTPTEKQAKNKGFISGYRVMEFFSLISAYSFLMPIIINYINYINWYKTLPAYLIFKPLITPSKGIEPLLIVFLGLALLAAWLGTSKYKFSDPKHQKLQRIKTFIISGLLFLMGLLYLLLGLANVLNFVGLPFYAPVQHPEGSAYLIVCGLISIATALMPSKLLFGKNLITELKNKFK